MSYPYWISLKMRMTNAVWNMSSSTSQVHQKVVCIIFICSFWGIAPCNFSINTLSSLHGFVIACLIKKLMNTLFTLNLFSTQEVSEICYRIWTTISMWLWQGTVVYSILFSVGQYNYYAPQHALWHYYFLFSMTMKSSKLRYQWRWV